jgi:uncharacterized protein RhaS with RHS repeats
MGSEYVVINRYYDPTTDQFLSVDPKVAQTDQPYEFINDSPLNATDPLGLSIGGANGESCISLSACSNPSVRVRNQRIESAASTAAFWAGVKAYLAMQNAAAAETKNAAANYQNAASCNGIAESVSHCDLVTYSNNENGSSTASLSCGGISMITGAVTGAGSGGKGLWDAAMKVIGPGVGGGSAAAGGAGAGTVATGDGVIAAMLEDPVLWAGLLAATVFMLVGAVTTPYNNC